MKAALRPALPLLIGIALAGVLALVAMHSLTFGSAPSTVGAHHSAGYAVAVVHAHDEVAAADAAGAVQRPRPERTTHLRGPTPVRKSAAPPPRPRQSRSLRR